MRRLIGIGCLGVVGCLSTGCTTTTQGQQEWGLRWGTEVTLFTRNAATTETPSMAKIAPDDRIMNLIGPPAPQVPEENVEPTP